MDETTRIFVAGRRGMVGSACWRALTRAGFTNLLGPTSAELDLTRQADVEAFFRDNRPQAVILAAARVGGILANATFPADFLTTNLAIQTNVIDTARQCGVRHLVFLGSSCIYPKFAPQPIRENALLTGPLEPTNEAYALAKIAGVRLCHFINRQYDTVYWQLMPTNLYGEFDSFDLQNSHVLPALMRKFHLAALAKKGDTAGIARDVARFGPLPDDIRDGLGLSRDGATVDPARVRVVLWGTGTPRREFMHVDDLAAAVLHVLSLDDVPAELVNVGCGHDLRIAELAEMVRRMSDYDGEIVWDTSKPDGTPQKLLDVSRLEGLGFTASISLGDGLRRAYDWYLRESGLPPRTPPGGNHFPRTP
ncbi:GDP-L-fucose synthase family protein, partial [Desulfolutivibrio sp.]|uniref:GDP-L-fucose synthase family protein n=1 Tax=Desulfolutivibrio sp. TaxID=2773296 RepID=UPI002F9670D0